MKKIIFFILLSMPVCTLWYCTSPSKSRDKKSALTRSAADATGENTVVMELFTSQGCSSCPPADRLLGTYTSAQNIIPLSFHVDYWNRQGWKDPFSSHDYSERQYKYASALKSGIYTPQLVIDGQTQMVGSEAGEVASAISKLLKGHPEARMAIENAEMNNGKINIRFGLTGHTAHSLLHVAFIEKKTVTAVGAGENNGATLTEYNVVRDFKTIDSVSQGENRLSLNIPASLQPGNRELVLFLQEQKDNRIIAAVKTEF